MHAPVLPPARPPAHPWRRRFGRFRRHSHDVIFEDLEDLRHAYQDGDATLADLANDVVGRVAAREEDQARQHRRHERPHRLPEHVAERQQVEKADWQKRLCPLTVLGDLLFDGNDIGQYVPVGDDDALGICGGAGGEDDLCGIVRRQVWVLLCSGRLLHRCVDTKRLRSQVGQRPHRTLRTGQRLGLDDVAGEDGAGADDLRDPEEKRRRGAIVNRDEDDTLEHTPPERDDPLRPVLAPNRDGLALADAGFAQMSGKRPRRARDLAIGQRPRAIAVVVDEEFAGEGGEIVEEVDERAPRHAR